MKKFIWGLIGVVFASAMAFALSSCSKEEVEPGKDKDEVTIIGTWRYYKNETKTSYMQITLEEDGTLIWREVSEHENETVYSTYTYENGYITWYEWDGDIEAIWYVYKLYKSTMVTYDVDDETGTHRNEQRIWTRIE